MAEYGVFSDEGIVEGGFASQEEAERAASRYSADDVVTAHRCCDDHPDEAAFCCSTCEGEDE